MISELPPSFENDLVSTKLAIRSVINDINNYEGNSEDLNKLNETGRTKISHLRDVINKLETYALEHEKTELNNVIKREKEQLQSIIKNFKQANIATVLQIQKKNQEELFAMSNPDEVLKRRNTRNHTSLIQQNAEISDQMSSVSRHLSDVVSQNTTALETLLKSSTNITGIREELKSTGANIDQSGKLLNKYGQREFSDKILITAAFIFFLLCTAYVVYCRI